MWGKIGGEGWGWGNIGEEWGWDKIGGVGSEWGAR